MKQKRMATIMSVSALAALSVAAWTGVLLRFGLIQGMPAWAANYTAVRHAHSHLMVFGWVTLALMALIWRTLPQWTGRALPRGVDIQMSVGAVVALLSFPAFWANGYGLTDVGALRLPLGSITATLNGLNWLWFAGLYTMATRKIGRRPLPLQLWDWGIGLMVVAFVGAAGLAGLVIAGSDSHVLYQFFLHLFLDLFAAGWFTLGMLGVLWAQAGAATGSELARDIAKDLPSGALAVALLPTFLLGMPPATVRPALFWLAATANVIAAFLLARHLRALWSRRALFSPLTRFGLLILALHLAIAVVLLWPGLWRWAGGTQLRVFYLHNFLLGWISSALLGVLGMKWAGGWRASNWFGRGVTALWIVGIALLLAALLGLGLAALLPVAPIVWLRLAAWSSILPATAAAAALALSLHVRFDSHAYESHRVPFLSAGGGTE